MGFKTFQSACKWARYGLKENSHDFELTCRKPECKPKNASWGVCDEMHCPFFGVKVQEGRFIDEKTGNTLITFKNGRVIFSE